MPTNDTQHILSTPLNEGEAQPIPATRIGYDNTTSGLTADNAQEAIDEVAGNLNEVAGSLNEVATDVDKIIDGELYGFHHSEKISITPDTTKTINENLTALRNAVNGFLSELTDSCWRPTSICVNNDYLSPIYNNIYNTQTISIDFIRILSISTALTIRTVYLENSAQRYIEAGVDSQGYSFTEKGQTTATDTEYFVTLDIYKKIGA